MKAVNLSDSWRKLPWTLHCTLQSPHFRTEALIPLAASGAGDKDFAAEYPQRSCHRLNTFLNFTSSSLGIDVGVNRPSTPFPKIETTLQGSLSFGVPHKVS